MVQRRRHLRFLLKAPPAVLVPYIFGEKLNRNRAIQVSVERPIYDAHSALADFLLDFEMANDAADHLAADDITARADGRCDYLGDIIAPELNTAGQYC